MKKFKVVIETSNLDFRVHSVAVMYVAITITVLALNEAFESATKYFKVLNLARSCTSTECQYRY